MKQLSKHIWKPTIIVIVFGIMAFDVFFDYRVNAQLILETTNSEMIDLPVGTAVGELTPNLTATTLDGETFQLSELRGKTVLVNVFASWCGPCIVETPHLVESYKNLQNEDVVFVGLNLQESPDAVSKFRDEYNI